MRGKRFIKSFINILGITIIINLILLLVNKSSLGEMASKITVGTTQNEKFSYAGWSMVQWLINFTIIGFIITIYFWATQQPSMAERFSGLKQKG
ncbi:MULTISPECIES: hypothetical protein [unclassified Spiroplasma]|uniref:hypothetical protein n=1 Tax=unclassified Spiroplasma TaxID=2637901 RepID=UPI00313EC8A8